MPFLLARSYAENIKWEKSMQLFKDKFSSLQHFEKHNEEFKPDERLKRVLLKSVDAKL
jgi:hypothetical protein